MRESVMVAVLGLCFVAVLVLGEVKCIVKFIRCDFEPSYKAEIVYGVGMLTPIGCIIGYMDLGK